MYQPKTGQRCSCRKGIQRDNCPNCEGTGMVIDFAAIRARAQAKRLPGHECIGKPVICPQCKKPIWDVAVNSKLNKCWGCGLAFD